MNFTKTDKHYIIEINDLKLLITFRIDNITGNILFSSKQQLTTILTNYGFDITKSFMFMRNQERMSTFIRQERKNVLRETVNVRGAIKHNSFTKRIGELGAERKGVLQIRRQDNTGQLREVCEDDNGERS